MNLTFLERRIAHGWKCTAADQNIFTVAVLAVCFRCFQHYTVISSFNMAVCDTKFHTALYDLYVSAVFWVLQYGLWCGAGMGNASADSIDYTVPVCNEEVLGIWRRSIDVKMGNTKRKHIVGTTLYHALIFLIGLMMVYPLICMVMSSFKETNTIFTTAGSLIPQQFTL